MKTKHGFELVKFFVISVKKDIKNKTSRKNFVKKGTKIKSEKNC